MRSSDVQIVHAFADAGQGGNPAGVVLDADALDRDARQRIAAGAGVPETAFVSRSDVATLRLEFFTPTRQIAHCGHATVATFGLLRQLGRLTDGAWNKETIDGLREVRIEDGRVFLSQLPRAIDADAIAPVDIAAMLRLPREAVTQAARVDTGNAFVQVEVVDADALARIDADQAAIHALSERLDLIGLYVHARVGAAADRLATTRMFAPRYGIPEEAATGTAASGLAWWRAMRDGQDPESPIEQGRYLHPASISRIDPRIEREGDRITRVWVGGQVRVDA
jgi:PhzF family phenazine biosynthesis protein